MSLLLSEGHFHARNYPVAVVWSEARIVRQRQSAKTKLDAAVMQMIVSSVFSKKAGKQLENLLAELDDD